LLLKLLAGVEYKYWQMLKDDEFQLGDVVGMNPILCCLANKVGLTTSGGAVAFDGVPAGSNKVI
jgi:hypothetical protein